MTPHQDWKEFIQSLNDNKVDYLVVGATALALHGLPRFTGDMDIWIRATEKNAAATIAALESFGFASLKLTAEDFLQNDFVQLGRHPIRIDVITKLSGITFDESWAKKLHGLLFGLPVTFLGRDALIRNKLASGRNKDLRDVEELMAIESAVSDHSQLPSDEKNSESDKG